MDFEKINNINLKRILTENEVLTWETGSAVDEDYYLFYMEDSSDITLYFYSKNRNIRALEFLDFIIGEYGYISGDKNKAKGVISVSVMSSQLMELDLDNVPDYLKQKIHDYFEECDWIYIPECSQDYFEKFKTNPVYKKKKIPWAVVKTTDIVPAGEILNLKTLENESGLDIVAAEDILLMIGIKGEVYDIKREVFEKSYSMTDERLDIFTSMKDFIPEVHRKATGEYITVDELALICYPNVGSGIYVKELSKRTKVFVNRGDEYYIGRSGDVLVAREDNLKDMYIIQKEVFERTYEIE